MTETSMSYNNNNKHPQCFLCQMFMIVLYWSFYTTGIGNNFALGVWMQRNAETNVEYFTILN